MERQQQVQHHRSPGAGGGSPPDHDLDAIRGHLVGMLNTADRVLDGIQPMEAEAYLQQSRQRGAQ